MFALELYGIQYIFLTEIYFVHQKSLKPVENNLLNLQRMNWTKKNISNFVISILVYNSTFRYRFGANCVSTVYLMLIF